MTLRELKEVLFITLVLQGARTGMNFEWACLLELATSRRGAGSWYSLLALKLHCCGSYTVTLRDLRIQLCTFLSPPRNTSCNTGLCSFRALFTVSSASRLSTSSALRVKLVELKARSATGLQANQGSKNRALPSRWRPKT